MRAPLAIEVLQRLEWSKVSHIGDSICPECFSSEAFGHSEDCALARALALGAVALELSDEELERILANIDKELMPVTEGDKLRSARRSMLDAFEVLDGVAGETGSLKHARDFAEAAAGHLGVELQARNEPLEFEDDPAPAGETSNPNASQNAPQTNGAGK